MPSAYIPGNTTQPTKITDKVIVWSQTLNIHHPAADLGWDSNGMTDSDGEKNKLGEEVGVLQWIEVGLPEKQVEFAQKF